MPVTFTAGYNHYFCDNHLGLGGLVSYERFLNSNLITTQAKITGQYGWEHFKMYHSFSAGVMFTSSGANFIADLTYLGLKFDFQDFNIFVEASIPTTALLKVGASYKF